ncbi:MAG: zinc finger domain-containing protein [Candidatus Woesearchaeota archaeon]|nr:zinc finger domain-containing protein [Candidatus Woesearchaeota archaeon]MDP7181915.1 zinc finger domain-containing protein [Candidatus Woesearchaeota archaeon]MDP7199230.1 zinc finger domain-containing protein [Candidatus Woesearchaeota archaeon]MDP7467843.1 zinc finger domain-containing protein [Candidatus Woesearchaeota archaeon]MDP7647833.1 zinc finger domain-containing protein [Candidatus Woesearchaeota archaeon]
MERKCLTCKQSLMNDTGGVEFKCPQCNDFDIIRCAHCRKTATRYTCPKCNFEGPN